ncbi:MAG: hypothetical protein OEM52_10395 [bacterium]|nr:hypothetical protein [bacterium]
MANSKKQVGDRVVITGGPRKGIQGIITAVLGVKVNLRLDDGTEIPAAVAWLDKIELQSDQQPIQEVESSPTPETEQVDSADQDQDSCSGSMVENLITHEEIMPQIEASVSVAQECEVDVVTIARKQKRDKVSEEGADDISEQKPITKMTVVELQNLAKKRDISIARTKADFLHIIKELEPECDTESLKGPALFKKVSELHISRLRSKKDLVELLLI